MSIVSPELDGAIATGDFPIFEIDDGLVPAYLRFALFRPSMLAVYENLSKGSTNRRRLDVADFLGLEIPKPLPDTQLQLAHRFTQCEALIQGAEAGLGSIRTDLELMLEAILHDAFEPLEALAAEDAQDRVG